MESKKYNALTTQAAKILFCPFMTQTNGSESDPTQCQAEKCMAWIDLGINRVADDNTGYCSLVKPSHELGDRL